MLTDYAAGSSAWSAGGLAAATGRVLSLLDAAGHKVQREYYVNDAGRQVDILAVSVWLKALHPQNPFADPRPQGVLVLRGSTPVPPSIRWRRSNISCEPR